MLNEDCKVEILTFDDKEGKKAYWHTASHIMAQAVNRLYPGTKFAIGPAVDNGFYYDMELPQAITNDDLAKIEAEMKKIIKEDIEIERFELPVAEALELMKGQDYKEELIREHAAEGEHISFYKQGDFTDLCAGPHLMRTGNVKAVKLTSITGAYWSFSPQATLSVRACRSCCRRAHASFSFCSASSRTRSSAAAGC